MASAQGTRKTLQTTDLAMFHTHTTVLTGVRVFDGHSAAITPKSFLKKRASQWENVRLTKSGIKICLHSDDVGA